MPLLNGNSQAIVSANIAELIRSGRSRQQSAAIAYNHAGRRTKNMAKKRKSPKRVAAGKKAARTRKANKAKRKAARKK